MDNNRHLNIKGHELISRLIGIQTPVGGIDWKPPAEEKKMAKRILEDLAQQQILWDTYGLSIGSFVTQAILEMRDRLQSKLQSLSCNSTMLEGLHAMLAACRKFLDMNQSPRSGYGSPYEAQLHSTLGELRALFGIHITRIACAYDLEVAPTLEGILPPSLY